MSVKECEFLCDPIKEDGKEKYRDCSPKCKSDCPKSWGKCIEEGTNSSTSSIKSECKNLSDIACNDTSKCFLCLSKTDNSKNCTPYTNIPDLTKKCRRPIQNMITYVDRQNLRYALKGDTQHYKQVVAKEYYKK